jgi:hypothetical protein
LQDQERRKGIRLEIEEIDKQEGGREEGNNQSRFRFKVIEKGGDREESAEQTAKNHSPVLLEKKKVRIVDVKKQSAKGHQEEKQE